MDQAQLRELVAEHQRLMNVAYQIEEQITAAVGDEDWFVCDVCGNIGPLSEARYMGEDAEDCCLECWKRAKDHMLSCGRQ